MSAEAPAPLERRLAALLSGGTWLACAVVAVGLVLPAGGSIVRAGIVLFIALPVVRVGVMLVDLVRRRDYRLAAVAAAVLCIIAVGVVLGLHGRRPEATAPVTKARG